MAKQLPESAMEPRPRRVTLDSEERCRAAFKEHVIERPETWSETEYAILEWGWQLCWRYLERQVQKEFIER